MRLFSKNHAALYREYYEQRDIKPSPSEWEAEISKLARGVGAKTILDYGCGPQKRIEGFLPDYDVINYDPGIKKLAKAPAPCDLVACLDVLEHVEEAYIDSVIEHLCLMAKKAIFIVVSCQESETKELPDGSAWHSFVRPREWWIRRLPGFQARPCRNNEFVGIWKHD